MEVKIKQILLEMYSAQIRGGFEIFDVMISLAEEVYCELKEIDIELFRLKKEEIVRLVFGNQHPHDGDWHFNFSQYMKLLDKLLEGSY